MEYFVTRSIFNSGFAVESYGKYFSICALSTEKCVLASTMELVVTSPQAERVNLIKAFAKKYWLLQKLDTTLILLINFYSY